MFTKTNQFQTIIVGGVGGKSVSRSDCEDQGGKLLRFYPNYVQEFGLSSHLLELSAQTDFTTYFGIVVCQSFFCFSFL
jgi:hypothetical protein